VGEAEKDQRGFTVRKWGDQERPFREPKSSRGFNKGLPNPSGTIEHRK